MLNNEMYKLFGFGFLSYIFIFYIKNNINLKKYFEDLYFNKEIEISDEYNSNTNDDQYNEFEDKIYNDNFLHNYFCDSKERDYNYFYYSDSNYFYK